MNGIAVFPLARGEASAVIKFRGVLRPPLAGFDNSNTGYTCQIRWDGGAWTAFTPASITYVAEREAFELVLDSSDANQVTPIDFETGEIAITKSGVAVNLIDLVWDGRRARAQASTVSGTNLVIPGVALTAGMVVRVISGSGVNQGYRAVTANDTIETAIPGAAANDSVFEVYERYPAVLAAGQSAGGASAEDVRIEMDANSTQLAALRTEVQDVPTNAEFAAALALVATQASVDALPVAIETALLNDGDGQALIQAVVDRINSDLDVPGLELAAIASAVRTELAIELARIDADISSRATEAQINAARDAIIARGDVAWTTGAGGSAPTVTEIRQEIDANSTQLAALLASTGNDLRTFVATLATQASVNALPSSASIAALQAILNQFTFTTAGQVDANIQYVNDVEVSGNGQTGTEWGPSGA